MFHFQRRAGRKVGDNRCASAAQKKERREDKPATKELRTS